MHYPIITIIFDVLVNKNMSLLLLLLFEHWIAFYNICVLFLIPANCIVMALDEHLPNTDKTILSQQLVSIIKLIGFLRDIIVLTISRCFQFWLIEVHNFCWALKYWAFFLENQVFAISYTQKLWFSKSETQVLL